MHKYIQIKNCSMQRLLFFLLAISVFSCVPEEKNTYSNIDLKLDNEMVQKVIDFQDHMSFDSLYPFLNHRDPGLRYLASNALSSQYENNSADSLYKILEDKNIRNKAVAAFALGQTGNSKVTDKLIKAFVKIDTTVSVNTVANANILEAIGKTGDKSLLSLIAAVKYIPSDNQLILGQTRAIYRYALRGIFDKTATEKMINYTIESHYDQKVRSLASSYLARSKDIDFSDYKSRLLQRFLKEENINVKMNLATVLGRTKNTEVMKIFLKEINQQNDYRVKINMVKALGNFPYINTIEPILITLNNENTFVAQAAADWLYDNGNKFDASIYNNFIRKDKNFHVNSKIYNAVLHHLSPRSSNFKRTTNKLKNLIKEAKSDAESIAYISALGNASSEYKLAFESLNQARLPVKTAWMEAIVNMYKGADKAFRSRANPIKKEILEVIKQQMLSKDVGAVALGAGLIADTKSGAKELLGEDTQWLSDIRSQLPLPAAIESYNELSKAISLVTGEPYKEKKLEFQHPINWTILNSIGDSTRCTIRTNRGDITIKLFPMASPGTVANFVDLVKKGYYEKKIFHRVVPNFVVQTGCSRGDGYGSLDYTIRSELSGNYYDEEGYIGMASAGKNTESTQWFITHRPTPHLDGKYTIFGKVTKGMDTVHKITQGDIIESISFSSI